MTTNFELTPHFSGMAYAFDQYLDAIYLKFKQDMIDSRASWPPNGSLVSCRRHEEVDGRHGGFWHIVSDGNENDADRSVNYGRCQRVHWVRPMLDEFAQIYPNAGTQSIRWWVSDRSLSKPRYLIALSDFSYVVMVDERDGYAVLVTAYPIEYSGRRKKFEKEHDKYWNP